MISLSKERNAAGANIRYKRHKLRGLTYGTVLWERVGGVSTSFGFSQVPNRLAPQHRQTELSFRHQATLLQINQVAGMIIYNILS